jgi:hypothetical protein
MLMSLSLSHLPSEENPPLWLARALSFSNRLRDQSERFVRVRGIETEGTGNALPPIGPQDRNRQIVEEGHQLMSAPLSQLAPVLAEDDVLDPVELVFYRPVLPVKPQQVSRRGLLRGERRDPVDRSAGELVGLAQSR